MTTHEWLTELVDWSVRVMSRSVDFEPTQAQVRTNINAPRPGDASGRAYRLTAWPELPADLQTADVYRALSLMSTRAVNAQWLQFRSRLGEDQAARLLRLLVEQGAVEVSDPAGLH